MLKAAKLLGADKASFTFKLKKLECFWDSAHFFSIVYNGLIDAV